MERKIMLWYPKCSTCQKAKRWLDDNAIAYELRDIKEEAPQEAELREWQKISGLPLRRFFNTSGLVYKALALKDRLASLTEDEQFALLATDGMLVKRPLLIAAGQVLVGFKENDWQDLKHKLEK